MKFIALAVATSLMMFAVPVIATDSPPAVAKLEVVKDTPLTKPAQKIKKNKAKPVNKPKQR